MEKITPDQRRVVLIFTTSTIPILIGAYFLGVNIIIIAKTIFYIILMFVLKIIFDFFYHSRIKIGEEGIYINSRLNKLIVPWMSLSIKTRTLNKDQEIFTFLENDKKLISLKIDYLNNKSFLFLIKKYCPKDHELYKLVEEYSKARKLPF